MSDTQIAGVDYNVAPVHSQDAVDGFQPQAPGRSRYRCVTGIWVDGHQICKGQLVWLSPSVAGSLGASLTPYP